MEEHMLRIYQNRVLRRIFGSKRDEMTRWRRKLHNKGLRNLYSLPSIIRVIKSRRMRRLEHVARMGKKKKKNTYSILVEKPEGKRPQGRLRHRWVNNIKLILER
jgi:hypothetical protein